MSDRITKLGHLVEVISVSATEHNASPFSRVVVREGKDGPVRDIEHVLVSTGLKGPEVIIQVAETPNGQ
jgi:hypothetical protein